MKSLIAGTSTGALVGALSIHFGFDPILHWTCVICSSIIVGILI